VRGAVHLNSGIPNLAFYNAAKAVTYVPQIPYNIGIIWFYSGIDSGLGANCTFSRSASTTLYYCKLIDGGAPMIPAIKAGWDPVGVSYDIW